jgi:hypothetical protein
MGTFAKVILVLLALLMTAGVVVTAGATLLAVRLLGPEARGSATQPARVAQVAASMADFDLPEGYRPHYAVTVAGFRLAVYHNGDDRSHLMVAQAPGWLARNRSMAERYLVKAARGESSDASTRTVDELSVTVRGEATTVVISEGLNHADDPFRQATAVFQGREGVCLAYIEEPLSRWDEARALAFLASIR